MPTAFKNVWKRNKCAPGVVVEGGVEAVKQIGAIGGGEQGARHVATASTIRTTVEHVRVAVGGCRGTLAAQSVHERDRRGQTSRTELASDHVGREERADAVAYARRR